VIEMNIAWFIMPVTGLADGALAWRSFKKPVAWGGVKFAAALVSIPYVLALLVGGFESVGALFDIALSGRYDAGWLGLPSPIAAAGILIGLIRHALETPARPAPPTQTTRPLTGG
jgi:hypothetical protein